MLVLRSYKGDVEEVVKAINESRRDDEEFIQLIWDDYSWHGLFKKVNK